METRLLADLSGIRLSAFLEAGAELPGFFASQILTQQQVMGYARQPADTAMTCVEGALD